MYKLKNILKSLKKYSISTKSIFFKDETNAPLHLSAD